MSHSNKRSFKKNLKKIKIKNSTRVTLVVCSLCIFAFSSAKFLNCLFDNDVTKVEESLYTYKNIYKGNYKVNIKDNSFITDESLPAGQVYVSDLIDSLSMDLSYEYVASDSASVDYNYKIDAVIGAKYSSNGTEYSIWNKTYNLLTSDSLKSNGDIKINEDIDINYQKYNQEVKSFKQTLGMNVDAYLYIRLTVDTNTELNNQKVDNEYVSNFSITLGDKIAVVDGKNEDTKTGSVKQENAVTENNVNIFKTMTFFIIMIISLYIIYYISCKTKKFNPIKNEFKFELNRILKSCQDRIVIVKNQFESGSSETVIDVNDFGELIKLSEELYKPILCWISDTVDNQEAWFSIISNKVKYRYILKK